jgi:Uma2 family endonuclease
VPSPRPGPSTIRSDRNRIGRHRSLAISRVLFEGLTLERFLRLPEAKPALEYIDGEVVQKASPRRKHSALQIFLGFRIHEFAWPRRLGLVYTELRYTLGTRSLVPDLCFIASGRPPKDASGEGVDDIDFAPDLIVEVISPGQTVKDLSARLHRCLADGVRLAWLIQRTKRRVYVFRTGEPVAVLGPGDVLDGGDVLPGFELPIDELFGWLLMD